MKNKILYFLKIFLINILILYGLLYSLEIFINYKNNKLFKKTRLYYINSLNKETNIYLNFAPYKILDKKNKLLPLSGYENSKTLLCLDEKNKPVYYLSDDFGFNNSKHGRNEMINFLLIGDSYVQGMCVDTKNNLNSQFRRLSYNTISLGIGGNGPLLELATFKEYEENYTYENIILFITPENDFNDLKNEINNDILTRYLNEKNFKQKLTDKKNQEIKFSILNSFFGKKTQRILNDSLSVYHFNLKSLLNLLEQSVKNKKKSFNNYDYLLDKNLDDAFLKIINEFINITSKNNKKIYVVFNSVTPNILYPKSQDIKDYKNLLLKSKLIPIKTLLKNRNISYFDFNEYLLNNYNEKNITKIFKKIDGRWDHYTEIGFYELVNQIETRLLQ